MLRRCPTLVTSRVRDYEHAWSPLLADAGFDGVYVLLPWRQDAEFPEFLGRLHGTGLLDDPDRFYNAISEREDLRRLVERPLYARMLTFIGEPGAQDVADPVSLYGEYLPELAHVAGASVNAPAGGPSDALATCGTGSRRRTIH